MNPNATFIGFKIGNLNFNKGAIPVRREVFNKNLKYLLKSLERQFSSNKKSKTPPICHFDEPSKTGSKMQSKINSFFKPPSLSVERSNSPPVFSDDENDELATWEKSQHTIVNTYTRRPSNFNGNDKKKESGDDKFDKPISETRVSREECGSNGRNLNKKRSYAQFHLELGQSDFLLHACSICGVKYSPGDEADERNHSIFHKNFTLGVQFKGWRNERVVHVPNVERSRVILVLDSDPLAQRNKVQEVVKMMETELGGGWIFHKLCKVYLFISSQRIAGCLVAEPIKEAFEVLSYPVGERQDGAIAKRRRSNPRKLQFGEIVLEREVIKRAPSEVLHENLTGVILCKKEAVHAVCGIRAIWVTPSNRRKGIATQLLEAVSSFFVLWRSSRALLKIEPKFILQAGKSYLNPTMPGKVSARDMLLKNLSWHFLNQAQMDRLWRPTT